MKSFILLMYVFASNYIFAQNNVGIGTTSPGATLDVRRGTAPDGTAAFHGTTNISHFNFGTTENTYIRGGKLSSHVILNDIGSGLVGIGIDPPYSPLTFNNNLGEKISLFGNSSNSYGFGIINSTFQIHADGSASDIAFGYGSSSAFTERMRIKGNGNVGIGNDPAYLLDLNGRMRIRSAGIGNSAGLWLNNNANTEAAFIGMEDDTHVGLYGLAAGWKFGMNTQTGGLKVNGSEGTSGQVLTSGGNAAPSLWQTIGSLLTSYFLYNSIDGAIWADVNSNAEYALPNSTFIFTVPGNSRLIISANYTSFGRCPIIGSCDMRGGFYFKVDGNSTHSQRVMIHSGGQFASASLANYFYDVAAGSHTIIFYTEKDSYNGSVDYLGFLESATIIVLPL